MIGMSPEPPEPPDLVCSVCRNEVCGDDPENGGTPWKEIRDGASYICSECNEEMEAYSLLRPRRKAVAW